jgi:hypothetical protein
LRSSWIVASGRSLNYTTRGNASATSRKGEDGCKMITKVVIYNESYGKEYQVELNHDEFDFLIEHCNNDMQSFYQYVSLRGGWKPKTDKTDPIKIQIGNRPSSNRLNLGMNFKTPEWILWREEDVYYAKSPEGSVSCNTSLTTLMNAIMEAK